MIPDEMRPYFRDVDDHLLRVTASIREFRELLTQILSANITQASFRQNEDVRKISAWAAIIAVPTLISGIYGMNFEHMPELTWRVGYPLALLLMAGLLGCVRRWRTPRPELSRSRPGLPALASERPSHPGDERCSVKPS